MIRHVLFTGEIGAGKSTALRHTLELLDMEASGIETYSPEKRGILPKTLYLRAYAQREPGRFLCRLPDGDKSGIAPAFDAEAVYLLKKAQAEADVIVIDEIGRLEKGAKAYHQAIRECLDGNKPVIGVIRLAKAEWADWIREREDVRILHVTPENRNALPEEAAAVIRRSLQRA